MTKSKPFCYAPWTTVQYQGTQGIKPCCEWKDFLTVLLNLKSA